MIYSTWQQGHIDGCCEACGYTFSVTSDEFSNYVDAKQALDQKFQKHELEKHSPAKSG